MIARAYFRYLNAQVHRCYADVYLRFVQVGPPRHLHYVTNNCGDLASNGAGNRFTWTQLRSCFAVPSIKYTPHLRTCLLVPLVADDTQ